VELSQGTERNSTLVTGSRTVSATGTITKKTVTEKVDDEVMFEMEKGPRVRLPSQTPAEKPKYRSRWMRRKQTTTMATQTTATDPETLAIKMESINLEAIAKIAKKREEDLQVEILSGSLWQERLKKQLQECSRNRRQASVTATNVDGGTSCRGATASRRSAEADDNNTDDWQAELLHDVNEETFEKLDNIAADIEEMATREWWLAFIKVGDTAVEHRVDPALFNLVDMPAVWDKLQDELTKEGKKTAVRHYQNILQLHASFWADKDTLHVAVVVPILRTDATIFAAYEVRIPPVLAGDRMAYLKLDGLGTGER
jgi:hypothetical protein